MFPLFGQFLLYLNCLSITMNYGPSSSELTIGLRNKGSFPGPTQELEDRLYSGFP